MGTTQVEGVTADVVQTDAEVAEKEAKKVKDVKQEAKREALASDLPDLPSAKTC